MPSQTTGMQLGGTLHGLLFEAASSSPAGICLKEVSGKTFTYKDIAECAERCAACVAALDADVVALVAWRSPGLLVSLLGVMRAGKAYCPIEPDFPEGRVEAMLESAEIRHALVPADQLPQPVLVGFSELSVLGVLPDGRLEISPGSLAAQQAPPPAVADDATAYVLFTSGSTGRPKGCMVAHRGSCNYAKAVVRSCGLTEGMVYLLKTPYVFDVSVQDIFTAFAAGGTLLIAPPRAEKDAGQIADIISEHLVNCVCFVPTLLVEFANYLASHPGDVAGVRAPLRRVLTIGEALMSATCRQLFQHVPELEIHNLYGPTEASVGVSHHGVTAGTLGDEVVVPIGRPFDYVSFKAFDVAGYENQEIAAQLLREVEPGALGELFIGGDCLAKGYINNPEKTSAAFFHFPGVLARPSAAASPFSLYKTGDLVRRRPDGTYEYMGRSDFQVKIGGVRIECEEVSAVLQEHPAVEDALVTAFDGPFGKALAAYVVIAEGLSPSDVKCQVKDVGGAKKIEPEEGGIDNVSKWGAVYDEMYLEQDNSISDADPTLNWSGYIDTYSGKTHSEHVIKEWVEWSCEQVTFYKDMFEANRSSGRRSCVLEIGCGNGMLLFRLAGLVGTKAEGRYIGTDISTTALAYIRQMQQRPEYAPLGIETAMLAAHEIHQVCKPRECDVALCNGVTMYFPSAAYLLDSMRMAADVTKPGGRVHFGDIQSKRHLLAFRAHVETYHALERPEATAAAVLHAVYEMASREELSYFDDELFHRLDRLGSENGFGGRVARVEMRLKRGWWGSEFSRFRYDVELVMADDEPSKTAMREPTFKHVGYGELCAEMGLADAPRSGDLVDRDIAQKLPEWVAAEIRQAPDTVDGFVLTLPNARTMQASRLLAWLKLAAEEGKSLRELPSHLLPRDVSAGTPEGFGIEPEMLFTMELPRGWARRVIWAEDPAMLRFIVMRGAAAERPWLGAATAAPREALPADLAGFKNQPSDITSSDRDPMKAWNEHLREWCQATGLLPAMRPTVYVTLDSFPKNAAGKTDRGKLPDAVGVMERVSDVAAFSFEPPGSEDEHRMVAIWEKVLSGRQVGVNTPFVAYGGHSLTAVQLCSAVFAEFGVRPDLLFLTSADCTVRELLKKFRRARAGSPTESPQDPGCITRLSPAEVSGPPLLIFCAAGAGVATYQAVAEQLTKVQVYAVELPGRGRRAGEEAIADFGELLGSLAGDVTAWAERHHRFLLWGDSLGAILAYEFAWRFDEMPSTHVMGLIVSGNAGPTVADREQGVGGTVSLPGCDTSSCANLTGEDWKAFLLASAGPAGAGDLAAILEDPGMARAVVGPLRADCLAYESYRLPRVRRLWTPIVTLCGANDGIATPRALRTWKQVAKGRIQHTVIPNAGHRIAQEYPTAVAYIIHISSLPSFADELIGFQSYRAAYRQLRCKDTSGAKNTLKQGTLFRHSIIASPTLGAANVPADCFPDELDLTGLEDSPVITPQSKQVIAMRHGNSRWRVGNAAGNPMKQVH